MSDTDALAQMLLAATRIAVFTGAGISTESGIPDFRSPGGVWSKMKPIYFEDFISSRDARRESWARVFNRTAGWTGAQPNTGHFAVADLVHMGKVNSIITQNVDNLHQDSGVPEAQVIEIHGNASYATCLDCGARYAFDALQPAWERDEDLVCQDCHGLIKSATISFGQAMPGEKMARAETIALQCDLMLVLGSSLAVYPAASLPLLAKQHGARLVIVNRDETDQDPYADLVLHAEIGRLLSAATDSVRQAFQS